jgi:mono/diheme cytochrome c family protein
VPLLACLASGWWYIHALPTAQQEMVLLRSARIGSFLKYFQIFAGAAALGALVLAVKTPGRVRFPLALVIVLTGWGLIGSFEFVREAARKPFLIYGHTYSNGIHADAIEPANQAGYLATAKWARIRTVTPENKLEAGAELFQHQCASCHSIGGPMNNIKPWAASLTERGMVALLGALSKINPAMPPFAGVQTEKEALAAYMAQVLGGQKDAPAVSVEIVEKGDEIPPFDPVKDEYVLLAWPDLGMHMVVEAQGAFILRKPTLELNAQLIKRDASPAKITEGVELAYTIEGNAGAGAMRTAEGRDWFVADLSLSPRNPDGALNPYPLATIEARNAGTKARLGLTRVALPVSDEVACASCHGGGDAKGNISGQTGMNILRTHDRLNRTTLAAQASGGKPVQCTDCHADPLTGKQGKDARLSVSAALHGFHANALKGQGAEACARCHPSRPDGGTRFQRGLHAQIGLDCTACHGPLEDHALSLLKRELEADGGRGKRGARRLISQITPQLMDKKAIPPRTAWLQTPDCLACHKDFGAPDPSQAFGHWTKGPAERFRTRLDEMGALSCPACHGPQHALYPSVNPYGKYRDALQPMQYQKLNRPIGANGNCTVCHKQRMDTDAHHPNTIKQK